MKKNEEKEEVEGSGSDIAYTPSEVADGCVRYLRREWGPGAWWDPCAGGGSWLDPLRTHFGPFGLATDIAPTEAAQAGQILQWDALKGPPPGRDPMWIVTNPSFSNMVPLLRTFLKVPSVKGIALLLLQQAIVPDGLLKKDSYRVNLFWGRNGQTNNPDQTVAQMVDQTVLYPRIKFGGPGRTGKHTDQREYCLVRWERQECGGWVSDRPPTLRRLNYKTNDVFP